VGLVQAKKISIKEDRALTLDKALRILINIHKQPTQSLKKR
jgi:hypothetical protein